MAMSSALSPTQPLASTSGLKPLHAYVETIDNSEADELYMSTSTASSPASSSRNSLFEFAVDDDDVEEIVREVEPLCRLDGAHEVARSLFGCPPPKNFGRVMPGIYRSAFPHKENLGFLKTLGLRSILTLVPENYDDYGKRWVRENGIMHFRVKIQPNKDPFLVISQCDVATALGIIMNRSNHPILVHCNKGKHRTGTLVGCLRKTLGWDSEAMTEEYRQYAGVKARKLDERYMDMFNEESLQWLVRQNSLSPSLEPLSETPISALAVGSRLRG